MAVIRTGQVTISASAQQISTYTDTSYVIKARPGNTGPVYIGESGVTTSTGYILEPGDSFEVTAALTGHPVFNVALSQLYVIGTSSDKISWLSSINA